MSKSPKPLDKELFQRVLEKRGAVHTLFKNSGAYLKDATCGSILFKLQFSSKRDLELFKHDLESGVLTSLIKDILITDDLKKRYDVNESGISFTIADPWEYDQCQRELNSCEGRVI